MPSILWPKYDPKCRASPLKRCVARASMAGKQDRYILLWQGNCIEELNLFGQPHQPSSLNFITKAEARLLQGVLDTVLQTDFRLLENLIYRKLFLYNILFHLQNTPEAREVIRVECVGISLRDLHGRA